MNPSAVLAQLEPPPAAPGSKPQAATVETLPWLWLNLRIALCIAIAVMLPELVVWLMR